MSKYSIIAEELKKDFASGKYPPGCKLPTEFDLVQRFNVSRPTIRQALSQLKNEGYVFQVQGSGTYASTPSALKGAHKKDSYSNVDVICTYISDYIFPSIIRGIEKVLSENKMTVRLAATGNMVEKERRILEDIINGSDTDAVIVEGTKTGIPNPNVPFYRRIMEIGIPVVFVHSSYPELDKAVVVGMKDEEGGKTAVKILCEEGCSRMGGIFKLDDRQGLLRYRGFAEEIKEKQMNFDDTVVRWYTTEDLIRTGTSISEYQAKEFEGVDGVVCYNDQIAIAFAADVAKFGLKVPKIVSFDKSFLMSASNSNFISLEHRKELLGEAAAHKIIKMINGESQYSEYFDWQ